MSRELLEYLGPWLLDDPDAMEIEEVEGDRGATVFEVKVASEDAGKIIGRRGRIIRSIRTLARAASRDSGPVMVEVVD
jgi:uncharacterized protein